MIVVCSIHQPRWNIFSAFNKVLLLDKGKTVYYGEQSSIVKYFGGLGLNLPQETNTADWILDITASSQILPDGKTLTEAYRQHKAEALEPDMAVPTEATIAETRDRLNGSGSDKSNWVTSFVYQTKVLLHRHSKQARGEVFIAVQLGQMFVLAVMMSGMLWQSDSVADKAGVLFFISIVQSYIGLNASMRMFPPERGLMIRERSTGSYRVGPYFLAKSTSDMGAFTVAPILFATLIYWCIGLKPEAGAFVVFLLLFVGQVIASQSLGLFLSTAIADNFTGQASSTVLFQCLILFGGFYVNSENIPAGIQWIKYLSSLFYGFGGMLHIELHGRKFSCAEVAGRSQLGLEECAQGGSGIVPGQHILAEYGFSDVNVWKNIGVLVAMICILRLMTYFSMRKVTKTRT